MSERRLVLKTQKNEVLELIRQLDLDPSEFLWRECDSRKSANLVISKLIHRPTRFYYEFDFHKDQHWARHSPAKDSAVDYHYPGSWSCQRQCFVTWLQCVKRETQAPDLWTTISEQKALVEAASAKVPNTPFSTGEQVYIATQLQEVKAYLLAYVEDSTCHQAFVEEQLDYVLENAKRQGRRDWAFMVIGILFSIAIQIGLPPDKARELFALATESLKHLLGNLLALP
ncbi:MAG TPA: hypothetical protein VMX94_01300 [Armatimonadota bacterium]|nr:hypothetical protein [Armatimonadota bacterium]